ncbi:hypothetical protein LP420_14410 [Massilia sp. B-10]|nr:hypothetical protein LP420_14410 [Massilia sp. B-10]
MASGPSPAPAAIAIRATLSETELLIEVSDDGVGLRQTSGKGLGLATVKARLRGRFGQAAVLEVGPGPDASACWPESGSRPETGMAEWLKDRWRRLRSQWRHTLGFAAVGALIGELREVPKWMDARQTRMPNGCCSLSREGVSVFIAALIMVAALRLATDNGSDLVSRPRRFLLLLLVLSSTIATTLSWSVYALLALGRAAMLR